MNQPGYITPIAPSGHGPCAACTCKGWKGGKRGMSGAEVCTCGHVAQVHEVVASKATTTEEMFPGMTSS